MASAVCPHLGRSLSAIRSFAAGLQLTNDPSTGGPGRFAEAEIRREAAARPVEAHIARRGIKFNIPLNLRTPGYTDSSDTELQKSVTDCEALAHLARYDAAKIRGACALALFDAGGDQFEQDAAVRHLDHALTHWKHYATIRDAHYVPALYNRLGYVDITALTAEVAADIELARTWKPGTLKHDGKRGDTEKGFRN